MASLQAKAEKAAKSTDGKGQQSRDLEELPDAHDNGAEATVISDAMDAVIKEKGLDDDIKKRAAENFDSLARRLRQKTPGS